MTNPGLKWDWTAFQHGLLKEGYQSHSCDGGTWEEADLLRYGHWQVVREVPKEEGRFYLWTDIWVTNTEEHKRTRRLTLRQMFLFSLQFPFRRPFDVVYKPHYHLTSNNIPSLCTSLVSFCWVLSCEKQGIPLNSIEKLFGSPFSERLSNEVMKSGIFSFKTVLLA